MKRPNKSEVLGSLIWINGEVLHRLRFKFGLRAEQLSFYSVYCDSADFPWSIVVYSDSWRVESEGFDLPGLIHRFWSHGTEKIRSMIEPNSARAA
jgi:hypothetical protein